MLPYVLFLNPALSIWQLKHATIMVYAESISNIVLCILAGDLQSKIFISLNTKLANMWEEIEV